VIAKYSISVVRPQFLLARESFSQEFSLLLNELINLIFVLQLFLYFVLTYCTLYNRIVTEVEVYLG
jgi:hypothetical protein